MQNVKVCICKSKHSSLYFLIFIISVLLFLLLIPQSGKAADDYPYLQAVYKAFPDKGTGEKEFYAYYQQKVDSNVDNSSSFRLYLPAGVQKLYVSFAPDRECTLSARSDLTDLNFDIKFTSFKMYKVIDQLSGSYDSTEWSEGKWVYIKLSDLAKPDYYRVNYTVNTNHPRYSKPEGNPAPIGDGYFSDEGDNDNTDGSTGDNSDDTDNSPDEPRSIEEIFNGWKNDGGDSSDSEEESQEPSTNPTHRLEMDSNIGLQNSLQNVNKIKADVLGDDASLQPKLLLKSDDASDLGSKSEELEADGYAMLEVDSTLFVIIPDELGNLSLLRYDEVGLRPYCKQINIDSETNSWECDAFEIVENFLDDLTGGKSVQQLADWEEERIIFYFGFAPEGKWDEFQGASFQVVR